MFKTIRHKLSLFSYSLRVFGAGTLLKNSLKWAADPDARNVDSGFDARYGTETNDGVTPAEAALPAERRQGATMYIPSMDEDLESLLAALSWPASVLQDTTFVDLGSGKGRAVFLAAMRPFREVVGVELSPILHEVAQNNLDLMRTSGDLVSPVRLIHGDATTFDVPTGPLVVYMYHPFQDAIAEGVMDTLNRALALRPHPAAILYCHPTLQTPIEPTVFARDDVFALHAEGERRTRRFSIGWTAWTNELWLEDRLARDAVAASAV